MRKLVALLLVSLTVLVAPTAALAQEQVALAGRGQTATETVSPPAPQSIATFTHDGTRNFIVRAHPDSGSPDLLVNKIGAYSGSRLLASTSPVMLDIKADGRWTATLDPIPWSGEAAFSGTGDAVSGQFDAPAAGAWTFSHDGQRNFIVRLHCAGTRDLIQNRIGAAEGSQVIPARRGPCFWEVQADGAWSLAPR